MNWSLKRRRVFWLGAGALTLAFLPMVSFAQLPARSASVRSHYTITDLGTLSGSANAALAINDQGDVVGWADTAASKDGLHRHAFLWHNGSMLGLGKAMLTPSTEKARLWERAILTIVGAPF